MAAQQPLVMLAGNDFTRRLTFRNDDDDSLLNLDTDVTDVEVQVKKNAGDADPALISLNFAAGVVKLAQAGDTLGQADFTIPAAATAGAFVPGLHSWDVVAIRTVGGRIHTVSPSDLDIRPTVNLAP